MSNRKTLFVVSAAMLAGAVMGAGIGRIAFAQQAGGGIKRTILRTIDAPGSTNYQAVMGVAEIAPNATSGKHRHPGAEMCYVLEGNMTLLREGEPTVTLKPGDSCVNEGSGVHEAKNGGTTTLKVLAVYLVEKGKPIAEPVP
jgi:quercetin dioxygenase-like cupin family protein